MFILLVVSNVFAVLALGLWYLDTPPGFKWEPIATALILFAGIADTLWLIFKKESHTRSDRDQLVEEAFKALKSEIERASSREEGYQETIKSLRAALEALSTQESTPLDTINHALQLAAHGNTTAAEKVFLDIEQSFLVQGDKGAKEAAVAAKHRGALAYGSDVVRSLSAYEKAAELDNSDYGTWISIGILRERLGRLTEAKLAFQCAVDIAEIRDEPIRLGIALGNLGCIHTALGELDEAKSVHLRSIAILDESGAVGHLGLAYGNLGEAHHRAGEIPLAGEMFFLQQDLAKSQSDDQGMALAHSNLGNLLATQEAFKEAHGEYLAALEINLRLERWIGVASNYGNLATILLTQERLDEAEEMCVESLKIETDLAHEEGMADDHGLLGTIYFSRFLKTGETSALDTAESHYTIAINRFKKIGSPKAEMFIKNREVARENRAGRT